MVDPTPSWSGAASSWDSPGPTAGPSVDALGDDEWDIIVSATSQICLGFNGLHASSNSVPGVRSGYSVHPSYRARSERNAPVEASARPEPGTIFLKDQPPRVSTSLLKREGWIAISEPCGAARRAEEGHEGRSSVLPRPWAVEGRAGAGVFLSNTVRAAGSRHPPERALGASRSWGWMRFGRVTALRAPATGSILDNVDPDDQMVVEGYFTKGLDSRAEPTASVSSTRVPPSSRRLGSTLTASAKAVRQGRRTVGPRTSWA